MDNAGGGHHPILTDPGADLAGLGGALMHQLAADAMSGLNILLGDRLDRHEAYARPTHGLSNVLGIDAVVLVAFQIGLDELSGDQRDVIAACLQLAAPVMSGGAGFHADHGTGRDAIDDGVQPLV